MRHPGCPAAREALPRPGQGGAGSTPGSPTPSFIRRLPSACALWQSVAVMRIRKPVRPALPSGPDCEGQRVTQRGASCCGPAGAVRAAQSRAAHPSEMPGGFLSEGGGRSGSRSSSAGFREAEKRAGTAFSTEGDQFCWAEEGRVGRGTGWREGGAMRCGDT